MKTLKCDLCEHETQGETFEEWMENLKPHYMEAHAEIMAGKAGLTPEEQKTEMEKWMDENKVRFDATS
jgi:predicted RNase H-like HicB family nuclease